MRLHVLSIINQYAIYMRGHIDNLPMLNQVLSTFSLPSLYPLCHSSDKLFQALSHFSILQVTESWAAPGNEARGYACHLCSLTQ